MCQFPRLQRRCRKSITSTRNATIVHWVRERRSFGRSEPRRECNRARAADLI
jgi:hypothetical protein